MDNTMMERLNQVNGIPVRPVDSKEFETYGRIIKGGNIYMPSVPGMEEAPVTARLRDGFYGGMDIQVGYCNGRNTTYNGFEYHKGSEINIAVTDFMLVLGHTWEIKDNTYRVEDASVFFVEKGTAIEMYQTTLHLSPCRVTDQGFKDIVVLPKGTNTPLKNREPLIRQGAFPGLLGENRELRY